MPLSSAYLQVINEVCDVLDPYEGQTPLPSHRAEEKRRGKDHSQEHLDTELEFNLQTPSHQVVFKAPSQTWKNPDIKLIPSAHFFSVSLGHLTLKKKVYILYQTESLAKDYVLHYLGKYHSLERRRKKKAFEKVGCGDAIGKVKDLNTHTHMNFEAELLVVS